MVTDIPIESLIRNIGHDGSEILWPEQKEPLNRRGFHIEEIQYALFKERWLLAPFTSSFGYNPGGNTAIHIEVYDFSEKLKEVLNEYNGLLLGRYRGSTTPHAVAWNAFEKVIYDPGGCLSPYDSFAPDAFYAAFKDGY